MRFAVYVIHDGKECAVNADGTLSPILYYGGAPNFDTLDVLLWREKQTFATMGEIPGFFILNGHDNNPKICVYNVQRFWRMGGMWAAFEKII